MIFKRIYVCRYMNNNSVVAYAEYRNGSRTEGHLHYEGDRRRGYHPAFGAHMHALFAAAKRQGLRLERET